MQRAAEARTSTSVSSISRITMRIIFAGSSERSRSSVMLAAKISRVREKIPIRILQFQTGPCYLPKHIQEPCQKPGTAGFARKLSENDDFEAENPCQFVGFATNS